MRPPNLLNPFRPTLLPVVEAARRLRAALDAEIAAAAPLLDANRLPIDHEYNAWAAAFNTRDELLAQLYAVSALAVDQIEAGKRLGSVSGGDSNG